VKTIVLSTILGITVFGFAMSTIAETPKPHKTFFGPLSIGQNVFLIEKNDKYEIKVMKVKEGVTHEVTEIGSDYVAIRNCYTQIETRIPIYNIKVITVIKD
jgi:hypothetical protein